MREKAFQNNIDSVLQHIVTAWGDKEIYKYSLTPALHSIYFNNSALHSPQFFPLSEKTWKVIDITEAHVLCGGMFEAFIKIIPQAILEIKQNIDMKTIWVL